MSDPFLAEIRIFSCTFAPKGWADCNGQLLSIAQNQALFSLLGTTYGGDGRVNFALPDLRGRIPFHWGDTMSLGERGGETAHTLTLAEVPSHSHTVSCTHNSGNATSPANAALARSHVGDRQYSSQGAGGVLNNAMMGMAGGSQAHENMPPYLVLRFCIALTGIFPTFG